MAIYSKSQTTVEGLDELMKDFAALGDKAIPYLQKASDEATALVLEKTKAKAPVLSGNLRANLTRGKAKLSGKYPMRVFGQVTFKKSAFYAVAVELGHRIVVKGKKVGTVKEHPFMRPAADESKDAVIGIMVDAMNKALDEMRGVK